MTAALIEHAREEPTTTDLVSALRTDAGPNRPHNEDACLAVEPLGDFFPAHLFAVADGLGGHMAGDVASRLVIETLQQEAQSSRLERPERWLRQALGSANLAIHHYAHEHPEAFNLQSTVTALVLHGDQAVIGHVGDCRAYLVRDGAIELCTTDHTRAMEMLRLRIITPEQAVDHPARSQLTRSLGAELFLQVDITRRPVRPGDTWVLCSDGLWSEVPRTEICDTVQELPPEAAADRLVQIACDRAAPDNVTVAVVRVKRPAPSLPVPRRRRWFGR